MDLEAVEQKALAYLQQVSNPLVRIEVLFAHLQEYDTTRAITLSELKDFLANHELFRVIEPLRPEGDAEAIELPHENGLASSPYVILDTRVPTGQQMAAMMLEQLNSLHEALLTARTKARDRGDIPQMNRIGAAIHRIATLRDRLAALHQPS